MRSHERLRKAEELWAGGTAEGCNEEGQVELGDQVGRARYPRTKGNKGLDWDDGDGGR